MVAMGVSETVRFDTSLEEMSHQASKQALDSRLARYRSNQNIRKLSRQVQFDASRRRLVSRASAASTGSRVFFHKRTDRGKFPKYQNTYRLESFRPFDIEVVDRLLKDTMESRLSLVTSYQPQQMAKLCVEIGADLQKALYKKDYDRYKSVVQVTIVQRLDQSIHACFQCLWDVERDNYSYHVFENNHIYAWCSVLGIYYE